MDNQQKTYGGLRELALFAGAGGGILGGHLLGWKTVCAVELDPFAASVLVARQNEGILPPFPIWDDVQTFDGKPWKGVVDVVSGGFPCQDISAAGKGAGIDGERSGMWAQMARVVCEVRPRFVFVENSPMLTSRGLGRVLGDLASMGYNAEWGVLGAHHVGAPHKRDRIWILGALADGNSERISRGHTSGENAVDVKLCGSRRLESQTKNLADPIGAHGQRIGLSKRSDQERTEFNTFGAWWGQDPADQVEPTVGRMAHGVANRVDKLRALGNGQVPAVARLAWEILSK